MNLRPQCRRSPTARVAVLGQQKGSKRSKSSLRNRAQMRCQSPQSRINRAIARPSSPIVVFVEQACHAGGRGFESRRSRKFPANRYLLLSRQAQTTAGFFPSRRHPAPEIAGQTPGAVNSRREDDRSHRRSSSQSDIHAPRICRMFFGWAMASRVRPARTHRFERSNRLRSVRLGHGSLLSVTA